MSEPSPDLAREYGAHRAFLWGLCYRLTGSAADAEDLVQETFVRALSHPPARTDEPWRPWLVRVALNLGRDLLRRRRRRRYVGPWLPSPIETEDVPPSFEPAGDESPAARYDLLESVSFAFLLALEALTPAQRAVLLLRDVFDYSVRETARALGFTEANVKTLHLRARRALAAYDRTRRSVGSRAGRCRMCFSDFWPSSKRATSPASSRCSPRTSDSSPTRAASSSPRSGPWSGGIGSRGSCSAWPPSGSFPPR